jgi:hypothetical protein
MTSASFFKLLVEREIRMAASERVIKYGSRGSEKKKKKKEEAEAKRTMRKVEEKKGAQTTPHQEKKKEKKNTSHCHRGWTLSADWCRFNQEEKKIRADLETEDVHTRVRLCKNMEFVHFFPKSWHLKREQTMMRNIFI